MSVAVYFIFGLLALCGVFVGVIAVMEWRLRNAKREAAVYRERRDELLLANEAAARELESLKKYLDGRKALEEEANDERKKLAATPDGGLVGRANALFGVRERGGRDG